MTLDDPAFEVDRLAAVCRNTAEALGAAAVPTEALAEFVPSGRRLLVLPRAATMRPLGEVWRLGVLLLDTSGELWAAGKATRAAERGRVGYQSVSREQRRDIAAAALRGGFAVGSSVNFDAKPLLRGGAPLGEASEDSPLGWADGAVRVRWRAGAALEGAATLEQYLHERAELLIHPPLSS